MTYHWLILCLAGALSLVLPSGPVHAQSETDMLLGNRLAAVLRAGRSVVSSQQDLINDPAAIDKGLTGDVFLALVIDAYGAANGEPPVVEGLSEIERKLTEAQLASMVEVIDESQNVINAEGLAFKGFIPAVFARLANERFAEKAAEVASIKVTAPKDLVRNRMARPDAWETGVIEDRFRGSDWVVGQAFHEDVDVGGKPAFRMLIPEYYSQSCLACHGGPKGETDVTGFPKEGGSEGELAGAISITLFK
jgi:hypothetical protein